MDIQEKISWLVEDVNGTIIGAVTWPYEFWTTGEEHGNWRIDCNYFENDEDAVAWFKEKYPDWFKRGVEMRVFE